MRSQNEDGVKRTKHDDGNVGDPNDPMSADTMSMGISEVRPALRLSLGRGERGDLAHMDLTVDRMEELAMNIIEAVQQCREQYKLGEGRVN